MRNTSILALFIFIAACSSREKSDYKPPEKVKTKYEWDHEKIKESREAEKAETAALSQKGEAEMENCTVMKKSQMVRAKKSGCRPMRAQEGHGDDAYCCPKD